MAECFSYKMRYCMIVYLGYWRFYSDFLILPSQTENIVHVKLWNWPNLLSGRLRENMIGLTPMNFCFFKLWYLIVAQLLLGIFENWTVPLLNKHILCKVHIFLRFHFLPFFQIARIYTILKLSSCIMYETFSYCCHF